jgi:hypothetical protein
MKEKTQELEKQYQDFQRSIQDRIDELYLIEKKAEDRAEVLQETSIKLADATSSIIDKMTIANNKIDKTLVQIEKVSDKTQVDLAVSQVRITRSIRMAVISAIITIVYVIILVSMTIHHKNSMAELQSITDSLTKQIKKTPVVVKHDNKNYVMVESDSERVFDLSNGQTGVFAELKYLL